MTVIILEIIMIIILIVHSIHGVIHHQHFIRMVMLRLALPWLYFCGDRSSPEPEEVFPEKIEPDIIDISNSPAVGSSSTSILSSPKFRPSVA